jgi:hypothetical protein
MGRISRISLAGGERKGGAAMRARIGASFMEEANEKAARRRLDDEGLFGGRKSLPVLIPIGA